MQWTRRSLIALPLTVACRKTASPTVFVDPALATLVPADTVWMAGMRMEKLHGTVLFEHYLLRGKLPIVSGFFKSRGLDLNKDLWEVLLTGDARGTSAMLRGKFSEMGMEPKITREGASRFGYGGFTFLGDEKDAVAFLNPTTALAGSVPALKHIIDHRNESSGLPGLIQARVGKIASANQIWFAGSLVNLPQVGLPGAQPVRAIPYASGGFEVGQTVKFSLLAETASVDDANRLRDSAKGVVGMGRLSTPTSNLELLRLYDTFHAESEGSDVRVTFEATPQAISELSDTGSRLFGIRPDETSPGIRY